ncbi:HNH endonuclease signature motif containing protein [Clostridium perfringens]|uniref:HNH endonuclease signature motif containing protein n=1 Tax=Clostridium perfringens TaxID=1502 RepID=UPI00232FC2EA|nr:HNH endonuclease signature motif containing protein [Clostridium perfringens]MDB2049600.1 HNH endonuclease signature motif containing protein [Clostridium perfringens]
MRWLVFDLFDGICKECGEPGEEVHHIIWLTPSNINDVSITLGLDNLVLLCRDCHMNIHRPRAKATKEGLMFDAEGNLIQA